MFLIRLAPRRVAFALLSILILASTAAAAGPSPALWSKLPLVFEPGSGEPGAPRFVARSLRFQVGLNPAAATVALAGKAPVTLEWLGANPAAGLEPLAPTGGASHYLRGDGPEQWRTGVVHYRRVRYSNLYPGIDLHFYGNQQEPEFDYLVHPGARAERIAFAIHGAKQLRLTRAGALEISLPGGGSLRLAAPVIYQPTASGRKPVRGAYRLQGADRIGFSLGGYDRGLPLVIDPTLVTSYLGGLDVDIAAGVAVDGTGSIYVTGYTASTNFPTAATPYKNLLTPGDADAFVIKLNSTATSVIYSTYLGGNFPDYGRAIAVDASGSAYVTGSTIGRFPVTVGAFRTQPADTPAIFVTKLAPNGSSLIYSTYLDGAGAGQSIALDSTGAAYIAGFTYTATFTTTAGAFQRTYGGGTDAFVTKLLANGSGQVYSTFLGGSAEDQATGIDVAASGQAFVSGFTSSANYPTTLSSFRPSYSGATDGFVTSLAADGATLAYSTYLGGANIDRALAIDINAAGEAFVTGQTYSSSFPTTAGAYRTTHGGAADAFVTRLNASGTNAVYSTFLGGSGTCSFQDPFRLYQCDSGFGIAVDGNDEAWVVGVAGSGFPLAGAFQSTPGGNGDAFLARLTATGANLQLSTYIGGGLGEAALSVATSTLTGPVVAGFTNSTDLPVTAGALQTTRGGGTQEGFLARTGSCALTLGTGSSFFPRTSGSYTLSVLAANTCAWSAVSNVSWITITSGAGIGNGQVQYTVAQNIGPLRVGQIDVSGQIFTATQVTGECLSLSSTFSWFPATAGSYFISVFATCPWTATTTSPWISIVSGGGSGDGTVNFSLSANNTGAVRIGFIDVEGRQFEARQVSGPPGLDCTYTLSSNGGGIGSDGGSSSFLVTTQAGCEWTTTSSVSWLTVTAGLAGSGPGVVGWTAARNMTGQVRSGVLTIAGRTYIVTQAQ